MKTVNFTAALHLNEVIEGEFQLIRGPYTRASCKRDVMFKIMRNGAITRVHAFNGDFILSGEEGAEPMAPVEVDLEALGIKIKRRFKVMAKLTEGIVSGDMRSTIISGATGIGKSFNLEARLEVAQKNNEINKFTVLKGRMTAIALYAQLYHHREEGDVLVLDDNDSIFQDENSLNLLKGALDTSKRRCLSWKSATTWLEENEVEDEFEFNGCCVFVTNLDFDRLIERGSSLAPHFEALLGRSVYLDLLIHKPLEIMVHVQDVVNTSSILDDIGIDGDQKTALMAWMWSNYQHMRELSLRTPLKLGYFMNSDEDGWMEMAEVTQLKTRTL